MGNQKTVIEKTTICVQQELRSSIVGLGGKESDFSFSPAPRVVGQGF